MFALFVHGTTVCFLWNLCDWLFFHLLNTLFFITLFFDILFFDTLWLLQIEIFQAIWIMTFYEVDKDVLLAWPPIVILSQIRCLFIIFALLLGLLSLSKEVVFEKVMKLRGLEEALRFKLFLWMLSIRFCLVSDIDFFLLDFLTILLFVKLLSRPSQRGGYSFNFSYRYPKWLFWCLFQFSAKSVQLFLWVFFLL